MWDWPVRQIDWSLQGHCYLCWPPRSSGWRALVRPRHSGMSPFWIEVSIQPFLRSSLSNYWEDLAFHTEGWDCSECIDLKESSNCSMKQLSAPFMWDKVLHLDVYSETSIIFWEGSGYSVPYLYIYIYQCETLCPEADADWDLFYNY